MGVVEEPDTLAISVASLADKRDDERWVDLGEGTSHFPLLKDIWKWRVWNSTVSLIHVYTVKEDGINFLQCVCRRRCFYT